MKSVPGLQVSNKFTVNVLLARVQAALLLLSVAYNVVKMAYMQTRAA